ncbi:MAG: trypsin-like peptidase domain-containing protein [Planctomycetota bacterium]|nr:trypsin-like peptidase domain-containing protein [Planctomycetota bacterium]
MLHARPALRLSALALMASLAWWPCAVRAEQAKPDEDALDPENDPDLLLAERLARAFQKVAKAVEPCVVSLTVSTKGDDWREDLWRLHDQSGPPSMERKFTGSGVIIDEDGTILTNEHVIRGAEQIRVTLYDGTVYKARVSGTDARSDLAVILPLEGKPPGKLRSVKMADSDKVQVGQWAIAVGNPFELSNTLTVGVVSARGRSLPTRSFSATDVFYGNLIQTDAAINPGNSGGPLFNVRGELIGINTMIFSKSGKFEGFGFAIPSNHVKPRLAALKAGQPVQYGWLGVVPSDLEPGQEAFQVPNGRGVLVERVLSDSPADRAGIEQGAVILAIDGNSVSNSNELIMSVGMAPVGKVAKVKVMQKGKTVELSVLVGLRTPELVSQNQRDMVNPLGENQPDNPGEFLWRGMRVRELQPDEARKLGGILMVVRVKKGSAADRAGLYEGAILDEIKYAENAEILPLKSLAHLKRAALETKGSVYVHSPIAGYLPLESDGK